MFGILLSSFYTVIGFVLREVVVKFLVLTAIYAVVATVVNNLAEFVGGQNRCCSISFDPSGLSMVFAQLPANIWWFLDLFNFAQGACIIFTAMVYRFLIRRIPLIG